MVGSGKMRVVQVGTGGYGGHRRKLMRKSGLFKLAAVHDWNASAMESAAREDGAAPAESYEALLETPEIEGVVISTGGKFHAEQVIAAAERGLHVFVEKPLCSTLEETRALLAVQRKTGVVIAVGHNDHRHDAVALTIKQKMDAGDLGDLASFEATTAHNGGLLIQPGDWRGDPEKNPGGMLFQCGVHKLHEMMFYFGPVTHVSCMMRYDVHTTGTADVAVCHLKFESGMVGTLSAYHVTPYRHTLFIYGTKANLYRHERYFDEGTRLLCQTTGRPGEKEPELPVAVQGENDACGGLRSWVGCVREGGEPYPSLLDGARAVAVVFAAEESARSGRVEPVVL